MHLEDLEPGTLIDTWRVVARLGAGGYGAVYKVEHVGQPGAYYALKVALNRRDKRTEREEQLLMGRAAHPNVVRLHASGRWPHPVNGNPYFVMSWVEGRSLDVWAETLNPSARQFAEKASKLAQALGVLHERGVLHRDLKPAHVIIRKSDGEPILIDLGVGFFEGADTLTFSVLPPATPHLLSPEAVGYLREHHARRDGRYEMQPTEELHALGVLLYRVATGQYPYSPSLPPDMLYLAIASEVPPAPTVLNPRVPRGLSDIILRLLAKDPRERFQTGQEVRAALTEAEAAGEAAAWDAHLFERQAVEREATGEGVSQRPAGPPESSTGANSSSPSREDLGQALPSPGPHKKSPEKGGQQRRRVGPYSVVAAVLAASVVGAIAMGSRSASAPVEPASQHARANLGMLPAGLPVNEVAQEVSSPETPAAAAPPDAGTIPAVVAAPAARTQKEVSVKKTTIVRPSNPAPKGKAPSLESVSKALCVGAAAATLACASAPAVTQPPVMPPPPPPEACPPGAIKAMAKFELDFRVKGEGSAFLTAESNQPVPITDGPAVARHIYGLGNLPGVLLYGRSYLSDRAYVRFTRARSDDGRLDIPVCIEAWDTDGGRGLIYSTPDRRPTAMVWATYYLLPVPSFE
ncbi:serine/threonine-protein kinase [Myxococcaceae bacterium GXIMD 01537]